MKGLPLDLNLLRHVGVSDTTGFISTTLDIEQAATFAQNCSPGRAYVYEMRVCGGVNIDYDGLIRDACSSKDPKAFKTAKYFEDVREEQEVSVVDGFPGADIISAIDAEEFDGNRSSLGKPTKNKAYIKSDAERINRCLASVARVKSQNDQMG